MSDPGRKNFLTKTKEEMTPDSSKSTQQKLEETVTGTGDKIARGFQPEDQKSTGQKISDEFGRSKDEHVHGGTGESIVDKAKNAFGLGDKH